ncbi:threonine transporter RhtB [Mycobacterium sp. MS1601]|uniref:homoserine/homoserine lactone efflux protein n=1 Tax=Mycobacterium sp. MS1601 TaxID=1936029 RepID=UPI0009793E80|nr:homoserine/homoserine lactone efflux protein [Mycobacterium sp. MS1601]AQA05576.1 threonine transporter RhtB [Mycobacterium sp. MS1601]
MEWSVWVAFLGASILISVSPGAGAILSMATGLAHGVRRSYWTILGLQIGLMVQLAVVAVGLGAALAKSVLAFTIIKWLGVAYLVYLAVRQWRTASVDLRAQLGPTGASGATVLITRGALVNLTNPKGLVFLLAVLPQFVDPSAPLVPQYLVIGVTMVCVDLVVMGGYAGLAARVLGWLSTPRQQLAVNRVFSGLFAAAAVVLSFVRRTATV